MYALCLVAENFDGFLDNNEDHDDQAQAHDDNAGVMVFQSDTDKNNNNAEDKNKV